MNWHTNCKPLPEELDQNECKNNIQNISGTDSLLLNQYFYIGSFIYFDRLSFQVQIEKKQKLFTVTKLKTVHGGVITYQPKKYGLTTCFDSSKSRSLVD